MLKKNIEELKADLKDKNAPFGVDLLLPKVGGNARKTNTDYVSIELAGDGRHKLFTDTLLLHICPMQTGGKLMELVDIIIQEKAALFM